jgi:hypothetical protein
MHAKTASITITRGIWEVMSATFFVENIIAITVEFTWVIHTSFAIMRLLFHKVTFIFNTILPTLNKM